ncbi:MAG: VWA domain-containing protein [Eubacteriales bacterium]|nr:VWA domain-containing protein [Eubacteriales bacterium]
MFIDFLLLLRAHGIKVSMNEWLTLMDGLDQGLHGSTFTGFYQLCRATLVKSETDYDKFDQAFTAFFKDLDFQEISDEMMKWLEHPENFKFSQDMIDAMSSNEMSVKEIEDMLAERLEEQKRRHNGGHRWVGTGGYTAFGNHGMNKRGVRVGGTSAYRSAFRVAGDRNFRDWRDDNTIDSHQFQMAFRRLRQLSRRTDEQATEFDIDKTIRKTCDDGGILHVEYRKPRRNTLKLMMLIDSGGSMYPHQRLTSLLFQSLKKANTFADLKIYYFHNCLRKEVYKDPTLDETRTVPTDWILKNISEDYRVIIVGDAEMSMDELMTGLTWETWDQPKDPSIRWFTLFRQKYEHIIWLHPQKTPTKKQYLNETYFYLKDVAPKFPMFQMSIEGINRGMEKLMENR